MTKAAALPELLAIAAAAGGVDAVRGLAKAFGGKRTWIPLKAGDNHPLVVAAGRKAADAIMRRYGNQQIEFPKGKSAITRLVVAEMVDQSANQVAQALGITYRQAVRLKKQSGQSGNDNGGGLPRKSKRDPRQIDIDDFLKIA